jgi:predicted AlkP superfamily phosphohydrolase/phosphomutase
MLIRLAVALCCLASLDIEAKIIETKHIEEVLPLIDDQTWLLVDLDNCMFQGAQALGHVNWFYDELQQRMQKGMTREEAIADAYPDWIKTQKVCKVKPLEEHFVPILLTLQSRKVTLM